MLVRHELDLEEHPDFADYVLGNHDYIVINGSMRKRRIPELLAKKIYRIVDAIESVPEQTTESITYRGVRAPIFSQLTIGDSVEDQAFVSTSSSVQTALNFAYPDGVLLEISWSEGAKLAFNGNEDEFTSLPFVEFEITQIGSIFDRVNRINLKKLSVEANVRFHRRKIQDMIDPTLTIPGPIDDNYYFQLAEKLSISIE